MRYALVPMAQIPSPENITAAKSPKGGWTKAQLAAWGISWPPPKGWRERLNHEYRLFQQAGGDHTQRPPKLTGGPDAPPVLGPAECGRGLRTSHASRAATKWERLPARRA